MDIESRFQDTVLADPGELGWGWKVGGGVTKKRTGGKLDGRHLILRPPALLCLQETTPAPSSRRRFGFEETSAWDAVNTWSRWKAPKTEGPVILSTLS